MSDTTEETPTAGRGKKEGPDRNLTTPVVKDQALFEFLELLFYADPEPEQYPERIELNIVSGRYSSKVEATVWTKQFAPVKATGEAVKRGAGAGKPSREQLVALSNYLLEQMRRNCNESGSTRMFAVHAWSTLRGDTPYMHVLKKMTPNGNKAQDADENEIDGVPLNREQKFALQLQTQSQKMFEMFGELMVGMVDRLNRDKERDSNEIDKLHRKLAEKNDQLERALSMELDREERREQLKMKRQMAEKGWEAVQKFGPMLMGSLIGNKKIIDAKTVPDDLTALREFLKTTDEGGKMTLKQAHDAFGDWDPASGTLRTPGVLSVDQAVLLVQVANEAVPVDGLDKLMPGGPLEITPEQGMQLMGIFGEQLMVLQAVFSRRQQAQQQPKKGDS